MNRIDQLTELFRRLPGIGTRQARRIVYHILYQDSGTRNKLGEGILQIGNDISKCDECLSFFEQASSSSNTHCSICRDEARDHKTLFLVARNTDIDNIEASGMYHGRYFILGNLIPLNSDNPQLIGNMGQLIHRLKLGIIQEVILGLPLSTDGEHTRINLMVFLEREFPGLRVSTLGRGMATGAELEYLDPETIKNALNNRRSD